MKALVKDPLIKLLSNLNALSFPIWDVCMFIVLLQIPPLYLSFIWTNTKKMVMCFLHCKQVVRDSALTTSLTTQTLRHLDDCLSPLDFFFRMLRLSVFRIGTIFYRRLPCLALV